MNAKHYISILILVMLLGLPLFTTQALGAGPGGGGGGEEPLVGNNLSFPVIAADGFAISTVAESLTVPYTGSYPGLTAEQIALVSGGTWYAQKVDGNTWQAEHAAAGANLEPVTVDWGDNIESVNPVVNRPFRLEVVLYQTLANPMTGYTMALLEYPSSPNEVQGTNGVKYASNFATIVTGEAKLVVQKIDGLTDLEWNPAGWWYTVEGTPEITPVSFGTELNVGGKYIFGASVGGWKPKTTGLYRITFYLPEDSQVNLRAASTGNFTGSGFAALEGSKATPVAGIGLNLSYVDVTVVNKRR